MRKGFIFDLDGTLLNSIADIGGSMNRVLARYNLPTHEIEKYYVMVGDGMQTLTRRALPDNYEDFDVVFADFLVEYDQSVCNESTLYAGAHKILSQLNELNIPIGICTNKKQEYTDKIVEHYLSDITFVKVIGDRFDGKHKPSPDYPLEIASLMDVDPANIYFVGDSDVDMKTAHNAGMNPIGVSWGFRPTAELNDSGAKCIIHKFDQLMPLI